MQSKKLEKLLALLQKHPFSKSRSIGLAMYLGLVFLGLTREQIAAYFGVKPTEVRHQVTVYGLKLRKSKMFRSFLKEFIPKLKSDQQELNFEAAY